MFKRILVGIDGSEPANHALQYAIDIAKKWNAELMILTVTPEINTTFYLGDIVAWDIDEMEEPLRKIHEELLMKTEEKLKEYSKLKFKTIIKRGKPSLMILQSAKEENADLIVVGSRGIGGIKEYLLGSTSKHVINHCKIPVLIIK
jgi:nucleotide-binding universal stress UspA family protein